MSRLDALRVGLLVTAIIAIVIAYNLQSQSQGRYMAVGVALIVCILASLGPPFKSKGDEDAE